MKNLEWRCRRGMKELDLLMNSYRLEDYPQASPAQQAAFHRLLDFQDPFIVDLLFGRVRSDDGEINVLIDLLRDKSILNSNSK